MIFALESPGSNIYRNSYTKYYLGRASRLSAWVHEQAGNQKNYRTKTQRAQRRKNKNI